MRGRDIKRYSYEFADKYILFIPWHFPLHFDTTISGVSEKAEKLFKSKYPAVYNHLFQYKDILEKRNKAETGIRYEWYALQRWGANYWEEFNKQKIIYQELTQGSQFAYDANGEYYINNTAYLITGTELNYLLTFLNSKLINFVYSRFYSTRIGGKGVRWLHQNMIMLPIIKREKLQKITVKQINSLIDRILTNENRTKKQMLDTEKLDILVYKTYKLTDEEMKFVSSSVRPK